MRKAPTARKTALPVDRTETFYRTSIEALVGDGIEGDRYLSLLEECSEIQTLGPEDLPELADALVLLRHLLECTTTAAFGWDEANFLRRTRAHFLLVGLMDELLALSEGAHSPALSPRSVADGAVRKTVLEGHPAHLRLKQECVAAVCTLNSLVGTPKAEARQVVAAVVRDHFATSRTKGFGSKSIEAHETKMRAAGVIEQAVKRFQYDAFPDVYDDDRPTISRGEWIARCLSVSEIQKLALSRVASSAQKAMRVTSLQRSQRKD